jgi:multiple sugar transport system permease protein
MGMYDYYASLAVPLAKRAFLTAFLLSAILAFGNFDLIYILSGAGGVPPPSIATLSVFAYSVFESGETAESFAAVIILAILVSVLAFLLIRLNQGGKGTPRRLPIPRIPARVFKGIIYVTAAAVFIFILFPIYWMFLTAFRPQSLDFVSPAILLPTKVTTDIFVQTAVAAIPYLVTTIAVSAVTMVVTVFIAAPAAYAVSRYGKRWLLMLSIYLYSVPSTSFVFGAFYIFSRTGLLNSWAALMLSYPIFTVPFAIWTMSNFYAELPRHYEEAAQVDGYSPLRSFYEIVMPLARPGLFATALISFVISWHLLLFPVVLSQSPYAFNFPPTGSYTVTQFAANFDPRSVGASVSNNVWVQLASSGLILSVPVIILAIFTQEYMLKGLYSGGVKG